LVQAVGSMQPYTHSEDPDGLLYVTKTLEEYQEAVDKDPQAFHHNCLRILLKQGEELPDDIDCLQFTYKVVKEDGEQEELEVKMEDFDFKKLFKDTLLAHDVDEEYIEEIWKTYKEISNVESD